MFSTSVISRSLSSALRLRRTCLRAVSLRQAAGRRTFSVSRRRQYASEIDPATADFMQSVSRTAVFRKLSNSPEALMALRKLADTMQNAGFDMSKQPTAMQMIKMMSNTQLREAAKDFREELKKAGVEFSQEDLAELMALKPTPKE